MDEATQRAIKHAEDVVASMERLILSKGEFTQGERINPLMAYWSLTFEFHNAVVCLMNYHLYGAAFALVRPIVEATIRAYEVVGGSEETLKRIKEDTYTTNFKTVGAEIDAKFGLGTLFSGFLNSATRNALHGYTHMGMPQLSRRFTDEALAPCYDDQEIIEVIRVVTSAAFLVNMVTTKTLCYEAEWKETNNLLETWNHDDGGSDDLPVEA